MRLQRTYGKRRPRRVLLFLFIINLLLFSCEDPVIWDLQYEELDLIVVEGKITNETKEHEVRLTRPLYEMNGSPEPVTGARVEINDGAEIHLLAEDPEQPGIYRTDSLFAAVPGQYYQLRIGYESKRITAVTGMVEVTPFQHMNIYQVQSDPVLYEGNISDSDQPAIVRLELDWSHVEGYENLPDSENHAVIYHFTLDGVDVNEIFKPQQEHVRFPPGTIVYREKESVNAWYGEFLRGVLSEPIWLEMPLDFLQLRM